MSWASQRRFVYITGITIFFVLLFGIPLYIWLDRAETCFDGIQNQTETAIDRGGPCHLLDERALIPHAVLWARGFKVRDGAYSGVAYIENPNQIGGVLEAPYRMKLYDSKNVLVAERAGITPVMPGAITPVYVPTIDTGQREVVRAFFEFAAPLEWERLEGRSTSIAVRDKSLTNTGTRPRLSADITNVSARDLEDVELVAVVFDSAGNAFAASSTLIPLLRGDETTEVVFTWPERFLRSPARTDILPLITPLK